MGLIAWTCDIVGQVQGVLDCNPLVLSATDRDGCTPHASEEGVGNDLDVAQEAASRRIGDARSLVAGGGAVVPHAALPFRGTTAHHAFPALLCVISCCVDNELLL
jgi:hypothetical protein